MQGVFRFCDDELSGLQLLNNPEKNRHSVLLSFIEQMHGVKICERTCGNEPKEFIAFGYDSFRIVKFTNKVGALVTYLPMQSSPPAPY